jgi:hypothetical protein
MKLEFSKEIPEKYSDLNFMELHLVGAEFRADGRTDRQADMTKLIVVFRNLANVPKNSVSASQYTHFSCTIKTSRLVLLSKSSMFIMRIMRNP